MKKVLLFIGILVSACLGFSQSPTITQIEFFYDTDPGFGNALQLSFTPGSEVELDFTLDISSLSQGVHSMYIRAKDENNHWSLYTKKNIFIIEGYQGLPYLVQMEYFWDNDPGFGQATPVSITSGTEIEQDFVINIQNMTPGVHSLYIRTKDMYNRWSLYTKKNVFITQGNETLNVVELEYFFDTDPGVGMGTSLDFTPSANVEMDFIIPLNNLTPGDHQLCIRAKDSYDRWSLYSQDTVHIETWGCFYQDVPLGNYAYDAVADLCDRGLLDDDGSCEPNDPITRAALAKLAYLAVEVQNNSLADNFPSPFNDLQYQEDAWYYSYAKNLAYLEFDDHTAPFDRNFFNFKPSNTISRAHVLKVLLEAWNIDETQNSGSIPFTDDGLANHEAYNYIVKAYDLGLIDDTFDHLYHPNDNIIRADVFVMLHKLLSILEIPIPTIEDSDFFIPGNYTPENFSSFAGLHSGNFNYYTKTSFAIASIGIPLSFEHTYNSYLSEMPKELIPLRPLGKMWNHTFNSYIKEIPGDIERPNDFRVVVALPNSGYHIYKTNGGGYQAVTEGVYNVLAKPTADKFTITTKSQLVYTYQKFEGVDEDFPYVLVSIHDRNGNTIAITYENGEGSEFGNCKRIKDITGTAGRKLHFYYHPNTDLISSITDPLGRTISFDYSADSDPKLLTFVDAKNQTTTYTYGEDDEKDLLMTIQLPKGNVINNTYLGKKLASMQTNNDNATEFVHAPAYEQPGENNFSHTTITSPDNQVTEMYHNRHGNPNHIIKDDATDITIQYDAEQLNKPSNITIDNQSAGMTYDNRGNILSMTLPMGVSYNYTYTGYNDVDYFIDPEGNGYDYVYNSTGNLTQVITPRGTTSFEVIDNGLVTAITNPEGITTSYQYDEYGNVIQTDAPLGISTQSTYDIISRLESYTNPNGITTAYQYDNNDNLGQETINSHTTNYVYDANDNLTNIINANSGSTNMDYDFDNDFLESVTFGTAEDAYTYHDDGKMATYENPNGITFTYLYDGEGRLEDVNSGENIHYTYDNHNNLLSETNNNGSITYEYDALNRLTKTTDYFDNQVEYEYDLNSNVTKITYLNNKEVNYVYDDDNLLHSVEDWNGNITVYTYRDDGLLSKIENSNGTYCDYGYDAAGRMISQSWKKSNEDIICAYTFTLDAMGNHIEEVKNEPFAASGLTSENVNYNYNNVNQIQTAGSTTFNHDSNGNILSKTGTSFVYNQYNQLTDVSGTLTAHYEYDAAGNRRKSQVEGVEKRYVLDVLGMSRVLIETDANNNPLYYYVYGLGLVSRIDASEQTRTYHYDYRGSTIAMTDASENITHQYEYNDFGQILQSTEADFNAYRYVGKSGVAYESDDLYFMRARYYDPSLGRFLSEDPIWSTNLYPYADNNPIGFVDPKGESALEGAVYSAATTTIMNSPKIIKNTVLGFTGVFVAIHGLITKDQEEVLAAGMALDDASKGLRDVTVDIWKSGFEGAIEGKITSGIGFQSTGGKGMTKLFGKTGVIPIGIDFRTLYGRGLKDVGHLVFEEMKNEAKDYIKKKF